LFLCLCTADQAKQASLINKTYSRIISFAPSITETLFALFLGNRVVGVSNFCKYPPEVEKIQKIGGYTNPNYEAVLRLKPDLAILLQEHLQMLDFLKKNKIDYLLVDNHNLASILQSIILIGKKCGKSEKADSIVKSVRSAMFRDSTGNRSPPKVLLCVDRNDQGCGKIIRAYAAGTETFYHDLLKMAGMDNALHGSKIAYPQISAEGIISMEPDIIIDIAMRPDGGESENFKTDWQSLPMVPAVKNNLVFCLEGDYLTIPGPRILKTLSDLQRIRKLYRPDIH
jgi:iron complex transport system substrate-binding protein